ncbi:hypothetical protein PROFUN_02535 [Planoprotostelium fungivorum]|uniref:Uncharacterized protein n=1 Tax=Planoprotostelium fungivorum TaxID=1890364 RepID=A0A2P6MPC4_9EUKA|nr:hypothetical protein PROFUN_02535 [Planoprotostelium fungivorum]
MQTEHPFDQQANYNLAGTAIQHVVSRRGSDITELPATSRITDGSSNANHIIGSLTAFRTSKSLITSRRERVQFHCLGAMDGEVNDSTAFTSPVGTYNTYYGYSDVQYDAESTARGRICIHRESDNYNPEHGGYHRGYTGDPE